MNRREATQAATAAVAGLGIEATTKAIDGPADDVLCIVIECDHPISCEARHNLQRQAEEFVQPKVGVPVFVLAEGLHMKVLRKSDYDLQRRVAELEERSQPCEITTHPCLTAEEWAAANPDITLVEMRARDGLQ